MKSGFCHGLRFVGSVKRYDWNDPTAVVLYGDEEAFGGLDAVERNMREGWQEMVENTVIRR